MDEKEITLKELRKSRELLEDEVFEKISNFEKNTGVLVTDISLVRLPNAIGENRSEETNISVSTQLDIGKFYG